jgi:C4-dicarboxylate-binding protein DctP
VDGTENPLSNFYTQRMHQVQKHLALTRHGYLGYAVIVNRKFWNGLPAYTRALLERAMGDATAYANRIAREKNDDDLEKVKAAGTTQVYLPTPEERRALRKALLPVHREMEGRIGTELIREIYAATQFDPNRS